MKIIEMNCETGVEIIREATKAEKDDVNARQAQTATEQAEAESKATAKAALLSKLGISEDEAKLLLS